MRLCLTPLCTCNVIMSGLCLKCRQRTLVCASTRVFVYISGWDDVWDDPKMGWSRWAHTIRVFTLNSGLFYIRPNEQTLALMDRITDRLNKRKEWDQVRLAREVYYIGRTSMSFCG